MIPAFHNGSVVVSLPSLASLSPVTALERVPRVDEWRGRMALSYIPCGCAVDTGGPSLLGTQPGAWPRVCFRA